MRDLEDTLIEARRCFEAGSQGDFRDHDAVRAGLRRASHGAHRAWELALGAQVWFAKPERGRLPSVNEVEELPSGDPRTIAATSRVCALGARAALLAFDTSLYRAWLDLHARVPTGEADEGRLWLEVSERWSSSLGGEHEGIEEWASGARQRAAALSLPTLAIESTALRAVAATYHDIDEATTFARRASRMARTESLPQQEYLVNVILARIRRMHGRPHLAARILNALLDVAPLAWRPWITWELLLAQGLTQTPAAPLPETPSAAAVSGLRLALEGAREGNRDAFDEGLARASSATSELMWLRRDLENLRCMLDPMSEHRDVDAGVEAFCAGTRVPVPDGLHGVCGLDALSGSLHVHVALVLCLPDRRGRRLLAPGVGLAPREAARLPEKKRPQARTDTAIAVLGLAGPDGLAEDTLFRELYGFEYEEALHRGVRSTLYTRVRERIESAGMLSRDGGHITLRLDHPVLCPDPRCSPPTEHTLLTVLAKAKHMSAKEAADLLGIPVRTVQLALSQLAEDGVCRVERVGRGYEYVLEDTTFAEPSRY